MNLEKKCSFEEHKEINAKSFCPECKIYMCNKCEGHHSSLFKYHHSYNINSQDEIFTGLCKEKNHYELKYFCKDHNQLCCSACICKLDKKGEGQHKNCDVCYIENIKEEKRINLKANLMNLEKLEKTFNESLKTLSEIIESIEKDKDNLKLEIQNVFTKMRSAINEREDELLLEVDNIYNSKFINEDIIKKSKTIPKEIIISKEKGKLLDKEWDNDNLISYINDCINIENNIKYIFSINECLNNSQIKNKMKLKFYPKEQNSEFIKKFKNFGKYIFLIILSENVQKI